MADSLPRSRPLTEQTFEATPERLAHGRYLAEGLLQCVLCHSRRDWSQPGAPAIKVTRGGGAIYWRDDEAGYLMPAPNLTPDVETGAGAWTDDMLARAIREGIGHDGRALNPAMPYGSFRRLSDEDVAALVVYLRSLPPVRSDLPPRQVPKERQRGYEQVPAPLTEPVPPVDAGDPLTRGRYLIMVADCMGCHTYWEGEVNPGLLAGGNRIERWAAPAEEQVFSVNITSAPSGIPYYDEALFREVMRTGRVKARRLRATMPWIAYRNLTDADLDAIFAALRTARPADHWVDNNEPRATPCPRCGQAHGGGDANRPFAASEIELPEGVLKAYAGTYRFDDGTALTLELEGDRLRSGMTGDLFAQSETTFVTTNWGAPISFVRDVRGRVTGLVSHDLEDWPAERQPD